MTADSATTADPARSGTTTPAARAAAFPFVELRGGPRARGRQFGEACREQVRAYPETLCRVLAAEARLRAIGVAGGAGPGGGPSPAELWSRALTFLPAFEAFAPHLVEEIRGIAEGAGVPFAAALLVNVRAEVAGVRAGGAGPAEECTAFAAGRGATASGAVLLGQNQDQAPEMEAFGVVVRVRPDRGPPVLMATFGGLVGYPGLNGAGVAHVQNALANGVWRHGLPHYPLKRVLLEQETVEACLGVFDRAPLASCGNYVLGDGQGRVVDVESTPGGYAVLEPERDVIAHTNHFRSDRFASGERLLGSLPDSVPRWARMRALLLAEHGRITLETVQRCLRDHEGGPGAICRHDPARPMQTIASIVAEPDEGRLHVARGNPCEHHYVAYSVE
jgi:isopenicillin-N N-acyltransferase-like protein